MNVLKQKDFRVFWLNGVALLCSLAVLSVCLCWFVIWTRFFGGHLILNCCDTCAVHGVGEKRALEEAK